MGHFLPDAMLEVVLADSTREREQLVQRLLVACSGATTLAGRLLAEVEGLKTRLPELTELERRLSAELEGKLAALPNLAAAEVPEGADEAENVEVRRWGEPFAIGAPKNHADLGEALKLMDFEAAARMSGARFTVLRGKLARLERAFRLADGQPVAEGPGLYGPSLFYAGAGRFSYRNLCNHWAARLLNAAGVPVAPIPASHPAGLIRDLAWRSGLHPLPPSGGG